MRGTECIQPCDPRGWRNVRPREPAAREPAERVADAARREEGGHARGAVMELRGGRGGQVGLPAAPELAQGVQCD